MEFILERTENAIFKELAFWITLQFDLLRKTRQKREKLDFNKCLIINGPADTHFISLLLSGLTDGGSRDHREERLPIE